MSKKDPRIDAYIAKSADFAKPILNHVRKLVHATCPEVVETMKWGVPYFEYKGVLCGVAAFREHCAVILWNGGAILGKQGEESGMGHFGKITSIKDLPADKVLSGYIKKGMALNESGVKSPARPKAKEQKELVVPPYLAAALKKNKQAQTTFDDFSYSKKKEYVEWLTEAKTEETRNKRLATAIEWMAEGKSRNWKYMKC